MIYFGTLIVCFKLGRRLWQRLGQIGIIYRPDGTDIWHVSDRMIWRLPESGYPEGYTERMDI